jgi:hypothetical protein
MAPAVLKMLASILDLLPIAYVIRIDTVDSQVYQHSGSATSGPPIDVARTEPIAAVES